MIKKIICIAGESNKLLIFLLIGLIIVSLLEMISIGFIPVLIQSLINPEIFLLKYQSLFLIKNFLNYNNLDNKNLIIFFIIFIIIFFFSKKYFFFNSYLFSRLRNPAN